MYRLKILILAFAVYACSAVSAQDTSWNGKECAVVLTYDDALNVHLDNVIPCLDSAWIFR